MGIADQKTLSGLFCLVLASACSGETTFAGQGEEKSVSEPVEPPMAVEMSEASGEEYEQPDRWAYTGKKGPEYWGQLSPEFETCGIGLAQSPVDIAGAVSGTGTSPVFEYQPTSVEIRHTGMAIEVQSDWGSAMAVDGVRHNLTVAHFHTPAEHTLDGKTFPMSLHFMHASEAGQLAVYGVLFEEGEANPVLETILNTAPAEKQDRINRGEGTIDLRQLQPADGPVFAYDGSLTTPPCMEGVKWFVAGTPVQASADQIARMTSLIGPSARPVQPLNGRTITRLE